MSVFLPSALAEAIFKLEAEATSPQLPKASVDAVFSLCASGSVDFSGRMGVNARTVFYVLAENAPNSASIAAETQLAATSPKVTLFQLDLTRYGLGIAYFTPMSGMDGQPITFAGQKYMPFPVEATGFEWNSQGQFPRPRMVVGLGDIVQADGGVAFSLMRSLLMEGDDLVGCEVKRIMTHAKFLDDGELPTPDAIYPPEVWRIERKVRENRLLVEFELASFLDNENARLPARQMLRDVCYFIYRWWDGETWQTDQYDPCPYMGSAMFDVFNNPVDEPQKDKCAGNLSACRLRFGRRAELPYGGFPGMARVR